MDKKCDQELVSKAFELEGAQRSAFIEANFKPSTRAEGDPRRIKVERQRMSFQGRHLNMTIVSVYSTKPAFSFDPNHPDDDRWVYPLLNVQVECDDAEDDVTIAACEHFRNMYMRPAKSKNLRY